MMEFQDLFRQYRQVGVVSGIYLRPARRTAPILTDFAIAVKDVGLDGDHYARKGGSRQVTLIQWEHIQAVASILGKEIEAGLVRRNLVVKSINLLSLKGKTFRVGQSILRFSGECHPCSRMEENLGQGGYNAMRGHGGITAEVISGGTIKIGDPVEPILE